jgi:transglutaminase-like putative cysteine protease
MSGTIKLERREAIWLLLPLALGIAPHTSHLPIWVPLLSAALIGWFVTVVWLRLNAPNRSVVLGVGLGALAAVILAFRGPFGREPGIALLVIFMGLKLLELRSERDAMVVVFLLYFLALTNLLYSQSAATTIVMIVTVWLATCVLIGMQHRRAEASTGYRLRLAGTMLAQALPLMVVLFILFPRIHAPLWRTPQDAGGSAVSGLSDTMRLGSIGQLILSDAIAFRVLFDGPLPPVAQLYWRGPVLSDFDGQTWRTRTSSAPAGFGLRNAGDPIGYEITLEPHNRNWLFALEHPRELPAGTQVTGDYQLLNNSRLQNRFKYRARSHLSSDGYFLRSVEDLRPALHLPSGFNPEAQRLGNSWRAAAADDDAILAAALRYYRDNGFAYTLQPPMLGVHSVDDFLFRTRLGFCEHFAASFVVLMRAAGIPARVVTGYQGGDVNPVDNYLEIRQANAHAWAEIFLDDRGWIRVDPTAIVAPSRVEQGLAAALPQGETLPLLMRAEFDWLRQLRFRFDAAANTWNQWVLGYNQERQGQVTRYLGIGPNWLNLIAALGAAVLVVFGLIALWVLRQRRPIDPAAAAYGKFCRKLARAGVARLPHEGPRDFLHRLRGQFPTIDPAADEITHLYESLRYGGATDAAALERLQKVARAFRVPQLAG